MATPFLPVMQFLAAFFSLSPASGSASNPLSILPNPIRVGQPPVLRMRGLQSSPLEIRLCDRFGRPLMVHPCTPPSMDYRLTLPIPEHLSAGMYLIIVDTVAGTATKPLQLWVALDEHQRPLAVR